jgi:hypothetical protein
MAPHRQRPLARGTRVMGDFTINKMIPELTAAASVSTRSPVITSGPAGAGPDVGLLVL